MEGTSYLNAHKTLQMFSSLGTARRCLLVVFDGNPISNVMFLSCLGVIVLFCSGFLPSTRPVQCMLLPFLSGTLQLEGAGTETNPPYLLHSYVSSGSKAAPISGDSLESYLVTMQIRKCQKRWCVTLWTNGA